MLLFVFLLCLPIFPLSKSKQFLVELKNGKSKMEGTNNDNGSTGAQQELSFQKIETMKNIRKLEPDLNKVENAEGNTESNLTTTGKISEGQDYGLFDFVCILFQFCSSAKAV